MGLKIDSLVADAAELLDTNRTNAPLPGGPVGATQPFAESNGQSVSDKLFANNDTAAYQKAKLQNSLTPQGDDGKEPKKTLGDFYSDVLREQPLNESDLKKRTSIDVSVGKSPQKASLEDYRLAYDKAVFGAAGFSGLLDKTDFEMARGLMRMSDRWDIEQLRAEHAKPGTLKLPVTKYAIENAKRSVEAVSKYRTYKAEQLEAAIEKGKNYATDAIGGFVQPIVNSASNVGNGVLEPVRAGERAIFGTDHTPEIPRMTSAERSEYWNKDGRMYPNKGAEILSTVVLGGAAGSKAIGTQAGRILLGTESAYNIGTGVAGKDITQQDANGQPREMSYGERALRISGGLLGARQVIKTEVSAPTSLTNKAADKLNDISKNPPSIKPQAVTPEGVKVAVPTQFKPTNTTVLESRANGFPNQRIPASQGSWDGAIGNSGWKSAKPEVIAVTKGKAVEFKNGFPDFSPWSKGEVKLPNMKGNYDSDFKASDKLFAKQNEWLKSDGTPDWKRVEKFRNEKGLTWHHHEDGKTMQLIPSDLNNNVSHTGGASITRRATDGNYHYDTNH